MKKLLLITIILLISGCTQQTGSSVSDGLKLKAEKSKILKDITTNDIRCDKNPPFHCTNVGKMKKYFYVSNEVGTTTMAIDGREVEEDMTKRTGNSMTYKNGKKNISVIYGGSSQFTQDLTTKKWYQMEVATTTEDAFSEQTKNTVSFLDKFLNRVSASDTIYSSTTLAQDGWAYRNGTNKESWAVKRAGVGTGSGTTDTSQNYCGVQAANVSNQYVFNIRSFVRFPTGDIIPSTGTVTGATLSIYGSAKDSSLGGTIQIDRATPAATSTIANGDYASTSHAFVSQSDTTLNASAWSTSGYNDFTLNATGLGNIGKGAGALSNFGLKTSFDMSGTAPAWSDSKWTYIQGYYADYTGTTRDPKLVVTWEAGGATADSSYILNFN